MRLMGAILGIFVGFVLLDVFAEELSAWWR